ncbi:Sec-independent protein translocase protein TatB [Sandaracinobacter sp. RS1-74]|uniref:Sec-independent protein translocase protein TatB n=1 Tax=Sandaracinobacteroides sayramensis TaxID=2913411 RepID=UPI001EDA5C49|nr:Sec-independent protein translocase protein TatB [Sandaracinobacteroides sayramensis]MCG2839785.1 Sec-independent protein translocase protein TatB [Sandaracinobacteroides sayramensis]
MFEIGATELLLIAVVALIVIGPKELPNALRTVGRYTGKARAMTRHLRSGFDEMMRQAELEEMEKQWAEHNRKIMAETPFAETENPLSPHGGRAGEGGGATPTDPSAESPPPSERPLP